MQSSSSGLTGSAVIDGLSFARDARELKFQVPVVELGRLCASLARTDGEVTGSVSGCRDKDGRYFLDLLIEIVPVVQCQRCLGEMALPLHIQRRLELVRSESDVPEDDLENETIDVVVSSREMSVLALVEDEILLALPMIPTHEDCAMPEGNVREVADHPLAGLAKFKKH